MSDQQPPGDPQRWGPPPEPLSEPTRARPDSGGERPTAPTTPPAAPTALPGQPPTAAPPPPPTPPPAGAPAMPAPHPGWAVVGQQHPAPGGASFPPPPRRRRIWPFAAGGAALAVLLVGVLVVAIVFQGGGSSVEESGYYYVSNAPVSEDAELAWSQEAPEGLQLGNVGQLGDDQVLVSYRAPYSSDDDEEEPADPQAAAYDMDGEERWKVSDEDLTWASPSLTGAVVLAAYDGSLAALDPEDGDELWSVDHDTGRVWEVEDSLVVALDDSDPRTVVLDRDSGEEQTEVDGSLAGMPGPDSFITIDDDAVRQFDYNGEESWSVAVEDLDLELDGDLPPMASYGDGLVAVSGQDEDENTVVGLDPDSGDELWSETGPYSLQYRGTDGSVAAIRWETDDDEDEYQATQPGELVLFDTDGERDAVEVEQLSRWGVQGFVDVDGEGEYYPSPEGGAIIGDDLEIVAEHDVEIAAYTADGVYLQDDDELTLVSWDGEEELYTIELEHDGWVSALDGAVVVGADGSDEFGVYR